MDAKKYQYDLGIRRGWSVRVQGSGVRVLQSTLSTLKPEHARKYQYDLGIRRGWSVRVLGSGVRVLQSTLETLHPEPGTPKLSEQDLM